ncbi:MAG: hypothetical protein KGQ36_03985 [Rickettsiales bacterium]|nr:hypothetical protein [Rickettsiales bacterium]
MNSRFSKKLSAFSLIELSLVILVVAILIAGVMQGRSLLKKSQINSAKAITQSSAVSSIKDLTLWIEPVMDNSFTNAAGSLAVQEGDSISSWNDFNQQVVLKKNLTQSTSNKKPTYKKMALMDCHHYILMEQIIWRQH